MAEYRADAEAVRGWVTESMTDLEEICEGLGTISTSVSTLEYSGPNADTVVEGVNTNLTELGKHSGLLVEALATKVVNVANALLGAGGVQEMITVETPEASVTTNAGSKTGTSEVFIGEESFTSTNADLKTKFTEISDSASAILTGFDRLAEAGLSAPLSVPAARSELETLIGSSTELVVSEAATITESGVSPLTEVDGASLTALFSTAIGNVSTTLHAQVNTVGDADKEAQAIISS